MIKVKPGVKFDVIRPAGYLILAAVKSASKTLGLDLTITSACDGAHSGPLDPHKTGEAYDVRSHDFDPTQKAEVLGAIMGSLEMGRFYGYVEGMGSDNEHYHIQRSKGTTFSAEDMLNA